MSEYVNCQHCINKSCERYGGPYGYTFCEEYIPDFETQRTNADRIRAMSDEELADMFAQFAEENPSDDAMAWLEWLQQPAQED